MSAWEHIRQKIERPETLEPVSEIDVSRMKELYPNLPEQYLTFLRTVGHGNLGRIQIYAGPMNPVDIYSESRRNQLNGIIIIGDDMQGFCYGFDLKDSYRVVEIDPRGNIDRTIKPDFESLVQLHVD